MSSIGRNSGTFLTFEQIPTNRQWREIQIAEAPDPLDLIANSVGKDQLIVDGKLMTQREYHGVKVLLPV